VLKDFFQKKRKYATITSDKAKRDIPEGIMTKCPKCGAILVTKDLEKNFKVCTACAHHFRLNAGERIAYTLDEGRLFEYDANMISVDPLDFPGYKDKLAKSAKVSGMKDAILTGEGTIGGFPVVIGVISFDFFQGTLGSAVGEKIALAAERAAEKKRPLILFSTSGGARMQEGILSLMQMAKTSAALQRLDEQGGLFISVITDPTYGGVSASFAMLGDYVIAEPGAAFGFAGRIVIEQTIRQKLPDNFQTSEFNLKHGQLDKVVHRKELKSLLTTILDIHSVGRGEPHAR